jgi:hypothetical protein
MPYTGCEIFETSRTLILAFVFGGKLAEEGPFHYVILGRQMRHRFFDFHSAQQLSSSAIVAEGAIESNSFQISLLASSS